MLKITFESNCEYNEFMKFNFYLYHLRIQQNMYYQYKKDIQRIMVLGEVSGLVNAIDTYFDHLISYSSNDNFDAYVFRSLVIKKHDDMFKNNRLDFVESLIKQSYQDCGYYISTYVGSITKG